MNIEILEGSSVGRAARKVAPLSGRWFKSIPSSLRGRAVVACQPHKLEVVGSNPTPAILESLELFRILLSSRPMRSRRLEKAKISFSNSTRLGENIQIKAAMKVVGLLNGLSF